MFYLKMMLVRWFIWLSKFCTDKADGLMNSVDGVNGLPNVIEEVE